MDQESIELNNHLGLHMSTKLANMQSKIETNRSWIVPICSVLIVFTLTTPSFSQDKNKDQNKNDKKNQQAIPRASQAPL